MWSQMSVLLNHTSAVKRLLILQEMRPEAVVDDASSPDPPSLILLHEPCYLGIMNHAI